MFGDVHTVDAARSRTDTIAVRDERIVALGPSVAGLVGPKTRVIGASGGLVVPGFQDAHVHVHVPFAGRNRDNLELDDIIGRAGYLDANAAYAQARLDEK